MRCRPLLVVLLAGCLLALSACGSGKPGEPGADVGQPMDTKLPASIADLTFTSAQGKTVRLSDFAGKVVLVSDTMTMCQETCPLDTAALVQTAQAANKAGLTSKVEYLTITVDPGRDTPARLAAYQKLYGDLPNWEALTGSPKALATLWKWFGVYTKKVPEDDKPVPRDWLTGKPMTYDIEHSDELFFLDAHQRERFLLEGMPHVAKKSEIPAKLYAFLSEEGRKNLASGGDWTVGNARDVLGWLAGKKVPA